MKITGELLKSERIKKDLTVQDIAYALKLSNKIVNALENGQLDELPAKTFVRGFVKSYAEYLKMDVELVLNQFQEEMGTTLPGPKPQTKKNDPLQPTSTSHVFTQPAESMTGSSIESGLTKKNIFSIGLVVILILVIGVINQIVSHYQNQIPQEAEQALAALNNPTLQNSSSTSSTTEAVTVSTAVSGSTLTSDTTQVLTLASQTTTTSTTAISSQSTVSAVIPPSNGQPVEIVIEARKEGFIEYAKGNTNDFKGLTLKAGTVSIIKSNAGLHLKTQDGSAFLYSVNGQMRGPISTQAKPAELNF